MPSKDDKGRITEAVASVPFCFGNMASTKVEGKFFCKLCREYGITNERAHLINVHKTSPKAMGNKSSKSIIKELFVECS